MQTKSRGQESLEETAILTLEFGRLLMESGASAPQVQEAVSDVALGLGAERMDLRVGYSSLTITIGVGPDGITRMRKVGPISMNQTLYDILCAAASRIRRGDCGATEARAELGHLLQKSAPYPDWVVALAVGVACAAFGRLLNVDWAGVGPIFVAAAVGQMVRQRLVLRDVNVFISTMLVAFLASVLSGLGARWVGSQTVARDMVAAVLMLVPGVPLFNALTDILEGRPTLGSARAVWVAVMLIFMTVGVWVAGGLLGVGR